MCADTLAAQSAEAMLLDKPVLNIDAATYDRFLARLAEPPAPNQKLRDLLQTSAPWEG